MEEIREGRGTERGMDGRDEEGGEGGGRWEWGGMEGLGGRREGEGGGKGGEGGGGEEVRGREEEREGKRGKG